MRMRNLYEVTVKGKVIGTFHKAESAYRLKSEMEHLGKVKIKKIFVDARP